MSSSPRTNFTVMIDEQVLPHGRGRMTFADGEVFEGEWKFGERHGLGTIKYTNGQTFEGTWMNDKRHGEGKMTLPESLVVEGEWQDDSLHRVKRIKYSTGEVFEPQDEAPQTLPPASDAALVQEEPTCCVICLSSRENIEGGMVRDMCCPALTVHRECIRRWQRRNRTCPMCRCHF